MIEIVNLDQGHSTTRLVSKKEPVIINNPEDKLETILFLPKGENRQGEGGLRTQGYFKFSYENLMMSDKCLILNDKNGNEFKLNQNSKFKIQNSKLDKLPLISIITVVYNGEKFLEETILSVINQTYPNVEYIIIDGSSTDGTIDIIKKYEDKIDYWVSESDKGIYDAMNKGIDVASGEWINFMNAGDSFYNDNILKEIFLKNEFENIDVVYGNHNVIYPHKTRIVKAGNIANMWKGSQFCHQSAFVSSKIHKKSRFNLCNSIGADFEFFYKIYKQNRKFKFINKTIANYSAGGLSDVKRIDSIVSRWNVVGKNFKTNIYYILLIIKEMMKTKLKDILH